MSVRTIFWENALTKKIRKPGGVTLDQALSQADANMGSVKDQCLAALDEKLPLYKDFVAPPAPGERAAKLQALYDLCNDVLAMAHPAGFEALGKAAYTLCDLADRMQLRESAEWEAVVVHIETIGLLRGPLGQNPEAAEALLDGLKKLLMRELAKSGAPQPTPDAA